MKTRIEKLGGGCYRIWQGRSDIGDVCRTHNEWVLTQAVEGAPVAGRWSFDTRREAVQWAVDNRLYGSK